MTWVNMIVSRAIQSQILNRTYIFYVVNRRIIYRTTSTPQYFRSASCRLDFRTYGLDKKYYHLKSHRLGRKIGSVRIRGMRVCHHLSYFLSLFSFVFS